MQFPHGNTCSRQINWDLFDSMQTCRVWCEHGHPRLLVNMLSSKSRFWLKTAFRMTTEMSVSTCQCLVCHLFTYKGAVFIKHCVVNMLCMEAFKYKNECSNSTEATLLYLLKCLIYSNYLGFKKKYVIIGVLTLIGLQWSEIMTLRQTNTY